MLQVAGKSIDFLVDTGATYSVLPSFRGTLCPSRVLVMGVNGQTSQPLETKPLNCQLDNCLFTHSFLVIPSCLTPLLGRDILTKFKTTFHLAPGSCPSTGRFLLLLTGSSSSQIDPQVWDIKIPTIAQHHPQVLIHLKGFLAQAQFPLSQPNLRGLKPIIDHLLGQGLLVPTLSPCNTPISKQLDPTARGWFPCLGALAAAAAVYMDAKKLLQNQPLTHFLPSPPQ